MCVSAPPSGVAKTATVTSHARRIEGHEDHTHADTHNKTQSVAGDTLFMGRTTTSTNNLGNTMTSTIKSATSMSTLDSTMNGTALSSSSVTHMNPFQYALRYAPKSQTPVAPPAPADESDDD